MRLSRSNRKWRAARLGQRRTNLVLSGVTMIPSLVLRAVPFDDDADDQ
jgi:hypothetical protein